MIKHVFRFNDKEHIGVGLTDKMVSNVNFICYLDSSKLCFKDEDEIYLLDHKCQQKKHHVGVGRILFVTKIGGQVYVLFSTMTQYVTLPNTIVLYENEVEFYEIFQVRDAIDILTKQPVRTLFPFTDVLFDLLCEVTQDKLRRAGHDIIMSQME